MRFLILTRLKKNLDFSKNYKYISIFLGPWCLPKGRLEAEGEIIKKKWCKPNQRKDDFEEIWRIKNIILKKMVPVLNGIHKTNLNKYQWDLIVGYWLYHLVVVCYERLYRIKKAASKVDYFVSEKPFNKRSNLYYSNSCEAIEGFKTDDWNSLFIETIIEELDLIKPKVLGEMCPNIIKDSNNDLFIKKNFQKLKYLAFSFIKSFIEYLTFIKSTIFNHNSSFLVYKLNINYLDFLKVIFSLKGRVIFSLPKINYKFNEELSKIRNQKINLKNIDSPLMSNDLENILSIMIFKSIPISYLENFNSIYKAFIKKSVCKKFTIFSTGAETIDDEFKIFASLSNSTNPRLIIGQHGSGPIASYIGYDQYRLELSHSYFSPGNGNSLISNKIKNAGQFWARYPKFYNSNKRKNILYITTINDRYIIDIRSMANGDYMIDYFENQKKFIENLPKEIFDNLLLRLYPDDSEWDNKLFLKSLFPNLRISKRNIKLNTLLSRASLIVTDYNASTHNESLAAGYPTILFWDDEIWSSHESSKDIFNILREANIFFDSARDAAIFASKVYGNIDKWWYSPKVLKARKLYCERYACLKDKNRKLINLLNDDIE